MMLHTQRSPRSRASRCSTSAAIAAELDALAKTHAGRERELRTAVAQRLKIGADAGARARRAAAAQGPPRPALRRAAVPVQDEIIRVLFEFVGTASLSVAESVRRRAHGGRRDRRLRPRPAGAGLRHRSAVPAALQADRLGRARRRGDPLLPVGPGAEGRPRHALDRRMHPPGQGRHDDPHRAAGGALPARRRQAVRRADDALRQGGRAGHRRRSSSPPSSPSARSATAAPASRAIWSSPTSRTARAACATCTRCSGSPNTSTACASPRN